MLPYGYSIAQTFYGSLCLMIMTFFGLYHYIHTRGSHFADLWTSIAHLSTYALVLFSLSLLLIIMGELMLVYP